MHGDLHGDGLELRVKVIRFCTFMERFIADDLAARNVSLNTIYFLDIFGSFSSFLWKFFSRTTTCVCSIIWL